MPWVLVLVEPVHVVLSTAEVPATQIRGCGVDDASGVRLNPLATSRSLTRIKGNKSGLQQGVSVGGNGPYPACESNPLLIGR
jgi:hypothetical protein